MTNFKFLVKKLDKGFILESVKSLPAQCEQAWNEVKKIKIPANYKNIENIIVCGMGGSNIGTDFLRNVFYKDIKVPISIVADYALPGYASSKSLIIISSYSGNTEESLTCLNKAIKNKCKIVAITAGGKLADKAKAKKIPAYIFDPVFNPSGQPRMGLGYSIMAQLGIIKKLNLIRFSEKEIKKAIIDLIGNKNLENKAQGLAEQIQGKIPIILTTGSLAGNAHILANQINENAKSFSAYFIIPELNHHLLEGLSHPDANRNLVFLFLESKSSDARIKKRIAITKKVIQKAKLNYLSYEISSKAKLSEAIEVLALGGYLSFYLAMLYKVDPSSIPIVDYFKNELAKEH
jgi:glucose/mannose-6-phosphate isomerase